MEFCEMVRVLFSIVFFSIPCAVWAQNNDPMSVLRRDIGAWDCDLRFYPDPNGQPVVSKATENNHAVGNLWVVGDFQGEMAGATFHGSSQLGYDAKKKKYIGSWVDSASPYPTAMEGTYDAASKTLTFIGIGKEPNGAETKIKLVTTYREDDTRTMSMYLGAAGDQWQRMMEVDYRRKKDR